MQHAAPAPVRRRAGVAVTVVALAAGVVLSVPAGAAAAPGAESAGRWPACRADIQRVRHVVLFDAGTDAAAAAAEIGSACGSVSGYYPEIAVAVATSADTTFADRIGRDRAYSGQAEAIGKRSRPARMPAPVGARSAGVRSVGVQTVGLGAGTAGSGAGTGWARAAGSAGAALRGDDDRSPEQWDMAMIGLSGPRSAPAGGSSVLVGVLDSGVDADHPELAPAIDRSASAGCVAGVPDTDPQAWQASGDHGTHVAGIIAAAADGVGITGVAPGVRIAAVKVVDSSGFIYPESAVCGFMWAARHNMRVTNNSYFVDPWLFTCRDEPGQSVVYEALRRSVGYATSRGVLTVAAAGNENLDLSRPTVDRRSPNNARTPKSRTIDDRCVVLPAELPDVLTVSAVGAAGVKSSYSSYGADVVDVAAPGGDLRQRSPVAPSGCVLSTVPGGYGRMCGTSMATPHATGVAALAAIAHRDASPAELTTMLTQSATPLDCPAGDYDPDSDGQPDATCAATPSGTTFYGAGLVTVRPTTP